MDNEADDQAIIEELPSDSNDQGRDDDLAGREDDDGNGQDDDDRDLLLAQIARDTATTKTLVAVLLAVLIVVAVIIGVLVRIDDNNSTQTAATTTTAARAATTTTAPPESAAGKPCVATVDPLPAGAPAVDVVVGPAPTTLVVKDLKEGTGAAATAASTVTVNYIGVACSTGKIFDSSYANGAPATFPLNGVIPGFATGITGMKVGGQRLLGIPGDQGYGPQSPTPLIAPDEALWFVVELTTVTP